MANIAITDYVVVAPIEEKNMLMKLRTILSISFDREAALTFMAGIFRGNDIDLLSLSSIKIAMILLKIDFNPDDLYLRGEISHCDEEVSTYNDDYMLFGFSVDSAWVELSDFRNALIKYLPDSFNIYYGTEEFGCNIFQGNDPDCTFIPSRYYVRDGIEEEEEYFTTFISVLDYLSQKHQSKRQEIIKINTSEELQKLIDDANEFEHTVFIEREYDDV